jgi:hypothetical protein
VSNSKDRAFAAVLKAYATSTGISLRTAQRHAKSGHPDWKRFSQATMVSAMAKPPTEPMTSVEVSVIAAASPLAPPAPPASVHQDQSLLSEPEQMRNAAWSMWWEHFQMWRFCLGGTEKDTGKAIPRDVAMAGAQAMLLMKLRADYDKALQKFTQWEIDQRRLIPANEFHAFRSSFIIPLRNMLANMPAEAAVLVNPANQQQAIRGGTEYLLNRLYPQIQQCLDALDEFAPEGQRAA